MKNRGMKIFGMMIWFLWLFWVGVLSSTPVFATAENFPYDIPTSNGASLVDVEPDTDIGGLITRDAVQKDDSLLQRLMIAFNLDTDEYSGSQKAFYYLKKLLNYVLGFVSLIAFGLLLYSFYMMLIGDGDKWRNQVKSTLKWISIALIVMSLSWVIVSMIFWAYDQQKDQDYEQQTMNASTAS